MSCGVVSRSEKPTPLIRSRPPCAVVLDDEQFHLAGSDGDGEECAVTLMATINREAQDVAVPPGAGGQIVHDK
jgi:hypothetical protein